MPQPTLQIHVGMDAWELTPVSLDEVAAKIDFEIDVRREVDVIMGSLGSL